MFWQFCVQFLGYIIDLVVTGEGGGVFKPVDVIPEGTPINTIRGK